jgi:hypothetical protein
MTAHHERTIINELQYIFSQPGNNYRRARFFLDVEGVPDEDRPRLMSLVNGIPPEEDIEEYDEENDYFEEDDFEEEEDDDEEEDEDE